MEMIERYFDDGFRPIPIYHPSQGCQCLRKDTEERCDRQEDERNQCLGKVPRYKDWADRDFTIDDFKDISNVALAMGKQPNGLWIMAIDIDGTLPWWWFDELPKTLHSITGRGDHFVFSVPPDSPLGNWTDIFHTRSKLTGYRLEHKGAVDIRYCRGAIVAPPSLHKWGTNYKWEEWRKPAELPSIFLDDVLTGHSNRRPKVKKYKRWSEYPSHLNKKP